MRFIDIAQVASKSLLRTKGRAALTMLGIIIGIASVILMLAVGKSAEQFLLSQVAAFGPDLIFVAPGQGDAGESGPPDGSIKQTLTIEDYDTLRKEAWVKAVTASVIAQDVVSADGYVMNVQVAGSAPAELQIFPSTIAKGRFITQDDVDGRYRVMVLGVNVAKTLFGQADPIGEFVKLGKRNYRVVGLMPPGGTRFFSNLDDQVYVPFTTLMEQYNRTRLNFISLKPINLTPNQTKDRVRWVLRDTHNLDNPNGELSKDDFQVSSQEDAARSIALISGVLQTLLGSIAAISLVVGGIGIMNIMYVTVTERTQEIGLRKSLGALQKDVLGQFLIEALLLTLVGGFAGVVFGLIVSMIAIQIINVFQPGWTFVFPAFGVMLAFGVSAAIGIVFGYFPARKAARLNPIEALRYE